MNASQRTGTGRATAIRVKNTPGLGKQGAWGRVGQAPVKYAYA